jgi:hypothetical protein
LRPASRSKRRWIDHFAADGPLPVTSTTDHGGELTVGHFVKPKQVMVYGRGSWVRGEFGDSEELGGGVKWHFLPPERLWLTAELFHRAGPYSGAFSPYTAGMTGWVSMLQTVLAF